NTSYDFSLDGGTTIGIDPLFNGSTEFTYTFTATQTQTLFTIATMGPSTFADYTLTFDAITASPLVPSQGNDIGVGTAERDVVRLINGNDVSDALGGNGNDYMAGGLDNDTMNASAGADRGRGHGGDDTIDGGAGNDRVFGDAGSDLLVGGADNDFLSDGSGSDDLIGGTGDDRMAGGTGADTFVFVTGHGADVITDFDTSEDVLDFSGILIPYDPEFDGIFPVSPSIEYYSEYASQEGANVVLTIDGGDRVTLLNTDLGDLSADNFILPEVPSIPETFG
ncbi:MAG: hypothetical protein P8Q57_00540, partial [Yoonia sp.]|nr:hypothetical protein [Yoonia sp.]